MTYFTNKLINETSPYLLQHAHNPVEWYPWGNEALEKAKSENKLLLISIGYSACHWCHVMERESFEDVEVATYMNQHFICVKVDREERPDVDQVYMDALQLLSGRGGWPLNCIALPDGRMVYGGTYFRKHDWLGILKQLVNLFTFEYNKLLEQAEAIQEGIVKQELAQLKDENPLPSIEKIADGIGRMAKGFDTEEGGFNGAPKFPMPTIWDYLLTFAKYSIEKPIKQHIQLTLTKMALGGIYDHVGGGFARYSVDADWHIPHFEKMLYDNAQLVAVYAKTFEQSHNELFRMVVYESISFIKCELTSPEGAFYSALDADSEGIEGKFYVWTAEEMQAVLGKDFPLIAQYYQVTSEGNWEKGFNVLKSVDVPENYAAKNEIPINTFLSKLETAQVKLLKARSQRVRPGLDDKIITSWNALMIKGLVEAYRVFENKGFLDSSVQCADFLKLNMIKDDYSLHRTYKNGVSKINGFLDDYAFTIEAFMALYQVTFNEEWLGLANNLTEYTIAHFYDENSGFFFYTSDLDSPLSVRKKELVDNVIPSSNSSMAQNLFGLSKYFLKPQFAQIAEKMLKMMAFEALNYGRFYAKWGSVLVKAAVCNKEMVIAGPEALKYYSAIKNTGKTNMLVAVAENESSLPILNQRFVEGKTAVYLCENNTCGLPVYTVNEAIDLIG